MERELELARTAMSGGAKGYEEDKYIRAVNPKPTEARAVWA